MVDVPLKAPFPWHGGKSRVAHVAWKALGNPPNYIEPFVGSCAMLLGRPGGAGKIETVNDIDGGIVNVWRAIAYAPEEVAKWCDWPVSELDLHARHFWLIHRLETLREELRADPKFFCAQTAGWWLWGICQWIGTGWCSPIRLDRDNGSRPHISGNHTGMGVHARGGKKRPNLGNGGQGVHAGKRQLPKLSVTDGAAGVGGVHRKMPKLSVTHGSAGTGGIHSYTGGGHRLPSIGNDRGIHGVSAPPCEEWFLALQGRLRDVRIVCGDWRRVLGTAVLGKNVNVGGRTPTGIFFDPPYDPELRQKNLYAEDDPGISRLVREWCLEHGDDPDLRIALCGYEGEHVMPGWSVHAWKGAKGYASADNDNRTLERIWFSPFCLPLVNAQGSLFEEAAHG